MRESSPIQTGNEAVYRLRATLDDDGQITKMVVEDLNESMSKDWAKWDAEHPYEPVSRGDVTRALRAGGQYSVITGWCWRRRQRWTRDKRQGYRVQKDPTEAGAHVVTHDRLTNASEGTSQRSSLEEGRAKVNEYASTLRGAGFAVENTAPGEIVVHGKVK